MRSYLYTPRLRCALTLLFCLQLSAAAVADDLGARLEALREAARGVGQEDVAVEPAIIAAQVCTTPDGLFSPVGVAAEAPFGSYGLAASYLPPADHGAAEVVVVWQYGEQHQALSVGTVALRPGQARVANGIRKDGAPLRPGVYNVIFRIGEEVVAAGTIRILPPPSLGEQTVDDVRGEARKQVMIALRAVDEGKAQPAAEAAKVARPLAGTAIAADPSDRNALGTMEMARAIWALGKMDALAGKQPAAVLDWAKRCLAHAKRCRETVEEAALKARAEEFIAAITAALPQLEQAANGQ